MPDSNIIQIDQNLFETKLDRLVTEKMTQILNAMLDAEADEITGAARYERKEGRKAYRAGHYERTLTAKAGRLELRVPKLKGAVFESAVIERYRRRESSVEEALMEMYLAGVSTRQVDDISKLLWGDRMPSQTLSDKLKRVYDDIDRWRTRPLESEYPYVFMDGVWHKRSWGGSVENVSVLVAIGVNAEGHREVIGVTEGMREDSASWEQFFRGMIERGLKGVRLVAGADSYETRSVIFTSNLEFSRWGDVFGDGDMAAAVIDRIVHHGRILRFHGESYRNKHSLMK